MTGEPFRNPALPSRRPFVVALGVALIAEGMAAGFVGSQVIYFHPISWAALVCAVGLSWAGLELAGLVTFRPRAAAVAALVLGILIAAGVYALIAAGGCSDDLECTPTEQAMIYGVPAAIAAFNLLGAFLLWRRGRSG